MGIPKRKILSPTMLSVLTWTLIFASPAMASHPYHVSLTEIEWNQDTGRFEVALCVWPADLEAALKEQVGEKVDLDSATGLDAMLQRYVASNFQVVQHAVTDEQKQVVAAMAAAGQVMQAGESKSGEIVWHGFELNRKEAWLYFEIAGLENPEQCSIENSVMFDLNNDQMNHVNFSGRRTISTVVCSPDSRRQLLTTGATRGVVWH